MSDEQNINFIDILISEGAQPTPQRMIYVKTIAGDVFAEDDDGQMIIVREDGTVQTFLHGDEGWVRGRVSNVGQAWEVIGFYLGMTDGATMERARGERTN